MQVELGAKVQTADGKQIGSIDKLILDRTAATSGRSWSRRGSSSPTTSRSS